MLRSIALEDLVMLSRRHLFTKFATKLPPEQSDALLSALENVVRPNLIRINHALETWEPHQVEALYQFICDDDGIHQERS